MHYISFDYKNSCGISSDELNEAHVRLAPCIERLAQIVPHDLDHPYAFCNVPFAQEQLEHIQRCVAEKKKIKPTLLIVVGIGGSNAGTQAVQEALQGILHNQITTGVKILYADTVDADYMQHIIALMEQEVHAGGTILLNVISKSGTTLETCANAQLLLTHMALLLGTTYYQHVVVTTDHASRLWHFAHEKKIAVLEIPQQVGGRFSVFTAVGLFPLAMMGINIGQLLEGARDIMSLCTNSDVSENPAALSALILFLHYQKNITVHDTFLFGADLQALGNWYRQLMAESLGKKRNDGTCVGMLPTVSLGTRDLHSMVQLYLAGPHNFFTTFVHMRAKHAHGAVVAMEPMLIPAINNKSLFALMDAIFNGVVRAYKQRNNPYVIFNIPEKSEYFLGQFLQLKMVETVFLGYLLDVNPFDQPQVELYKQETRKILEHE